MPKPSAQDGLTDRQRAFVGYYVKSLNAAQSAIKAGYSKQTAYSIGWENLRKPAIIAALTVAKAKISAVDDITRGRIQAELARAGFGDPEEPLKWSDKNKALVDLGRSIGMFEEQSQALSVSVNINDSASIAREIAGRITGIAARLGAGVVPSQSDAGRERGTPLELAPLLGKTKPDSSAG